MHTMETNVLYAALWILCGFASATFNRSKHLSGPSWFFVAVLIGPLGFVLAFLDLHNRDVVEQRTMRAVNPSRPADVSMQRPRDPFRIERVSVSDWRLPSNEPRIFLAQTRAHFRTGNAFDGRIRHADDVPSVRLLVSALRFALHAKADIVVFPEYACPFQQRASLFSTLRAELRDGQACLLPFEHLTLQEYRRVLEEVVRDDLCTSSLEEIEESVAPQNLDRVIVNCAIFFLKAGGQMHAIPQCKLQPAALEEVGDQWIFGGGSTIRVVSGDSLSVATLICFDFVARDVGHDARPREALAKSDVDLILVPECNPKPLHTMYAAGLVSLFEGPAWKSRPPVIVFANVARETTLPNVESTFGFSRVVGRLGLVGEPAHSSFRVFEGTAVHDAPISLLATPPKEWSIAGVTTVVFRPHESLGEVVLPPVWGPTKDPAAGRLGTEVRVYRRADDLEAGWQPIAPTAHSRGVIVTDGVPTGLTNERGLVGGNALREELAKGLEHGAGPLWVLGDGGAGKTALVADAIYRDVEVTHKARVFWVDVAQVRRNDEEALVEAILLLTGKGGALCRPLEEQWLVAVHELSSRATVLVLDSFELWGEDLPQPIAGLGWPTRVVVTSRQQPLAGPSLRVAPLDMEAARLLLEEKAESKIDVEDEEALYTAVSGSPLGCVWVGGLVKQNPTIARWVLGAIRQAVAPTLETLFELCTRDLSPLELGVLAVVSELPAGLDLPAFADVLQEDESDVRSALNKLKGRNLVLEDAERDTDVSFHTKHPFVRQFWKASALADDPRHEDRLITWARRRLKQDAGDRNWRGFPRLNRHWTNIRYIVSLQADARPAVFLELWNLCDYFLWSTGRYRDRLDLGRIAIEISRQERRLDLTARALYDSIAETEWHRQGTRPTIERYLEEAEAIYREISDALGIVMVAYYRGRMLRRFGEVGPALAAAQEAVNAARATNNPHLLGICLNGLGNVHRDQEAYDAARTCYEEASQLMTGCGDEEMQAVLWRNLGRVDLQQTRLGSALERFEKAIRIFRELELRVEEAEAAHYHARALTAVGEYEEARGELDWARRTIEALGSRPRAEEFSATEHSIQRAETLDQGEAR